MRYMSREWCELATIPLFRRVYISLRKRDMEVFKRIAGHNILSGCVRELVYDASHFYIKHPFAYCEQLLCGLRMVASYWAAKKRKWNSPNRRINELMKTLESDIPIDEDLVDKYRGDVFIVEGYKAYVRVMKYEQRTLGSASFFNELTSGLRRLDQLHSVVLSNQIWTNRLMEIDDEDPLALSRQRSGTPFKRSWNPFYVCPNPWKHSKDGSQNCIYHFYSLTCALPISNREITSFKLDAGLAENGLPSYALFAPVMDIGDPLSFVVDAYRGLEILELDIGARVMLGEDCFGAWPTSERDPMRILPALLRELEGLRELSLNLCKIDTSDPVPTGPMYTFEQVFPIDRKWPHLTKFQINHLAIDGSTFMALIYDCMPRLSWLTLEDIDLMGGTWQGVVEGMRFRRLNRLSLQGNLNNADGSCFEPGYLGEGACTDTRLLKRIQDYVVDGGRHPCLPKGKYERDAVFWCLNMMPESWLEELICQIHMYGRSVEPIMGIISTEKIPRL